MRSHLSARWGISLLALIALAGAFFWLRPTPSPSSASQQTAVETPFRVLATYPHDTTAFTQGLLWHDGHLIEGTGREKHSKLRRLDLESGKVLLRHKLPHDVFGEGVALANGKLIQLSWKNKRAFVYDAKTFEPLTEWRYEGEGWGLTFDGQQLIMSDGSSRLSFRDPETFAIKSTLPVTFNGKPVQNLNELEWIEGEIWANVWLTDYIVRINPKTGIVEKYLDCTNLLDSSRRRGQEDVLNGIAYDAEKKRVFLTGKLWPQLFEIKVEN